MKKIILFTFFAFISFESFSCSCDAISFDKAIKWADEIFIGRLIEVKELYSETFEQDPDKKYTGAFYAEFEVEKKWKGSSNKYIRIYQKSSSCQFYFTNIGSSYLVYAKKEDMYWFMKKTPTTHLCSRTISKHKLESFFDNKKFPDDRPELDKTFPNLVKINSIYFNWISILKWLFVFSFGLFIGYKLKKKINTSNLQAQ